MIGGIKNRDADLKGMEKKEKKEEPNLLLCQCLNGRVFVLKTQESSLSVTQKIAESETCLMSIKRQKKKN